MSLQNHNIQVIVKMRSLSKAALIVVVGALTNVIFKAYGQGPTEYEVKAAFLYNFAKFVEW